MRGRQHAPCPGFRPCQGLRRPRSDASNRAARLFCRVRPCPQVQNGRHRRRRKRQARRGRTTAGAKRQASPRAPSGKNRRRRIHAHKKSAPCRTRRACNAIQSWQAATGRSAASTTARSSPAAGQWSWDRHRREPASWPRPRDAPLQSRSHPQGLFQCG